MSLTQKRWVQGFHINAGGVLFGGQMLSWVDEDCTMCACELSAPGTKFTTAGYDRVNFYKQVRQGDRLTFEYEAIHVGKTSLTLLVKVGNAALENVFSCVATVVCVNDEIKAAGVATRLPSGFLRDRTAAQEARWKFVEMLKQSRKECPTP
jgi:acyl-CoA thioesterase YciA